MSFSFFPSPHLGNLSNSVDLEPPASLEAGWSGSTMIAVQLMLLHDLVDVRVTCNHLLKKQRMIFLFLFF